MPSSATPSSVPSRLGNRMHSPKKTVYRSAATPLPWVLATPTRRRISQAILEQEKTPEKFQEPSLAGVYFGSSPNSSRSSGFDRKPSRSCSMASFASGSELNFRIMQ